jgi:hypothetical protein
MCSDTENATFPISLRRNHKVRLSLCLAYSPAIAYFPPNTRLQELEIVLGGSSTEPLANSALVHSLPEEIHAEADNGPHKSFGNTSRNMDLASREPLRNANDPSVITEMPQTAEAERPSTPPSPVVMSSPGPIVALGAADSDEEAHPTKMWTEIHQLKQQLLEELHVFEDLTKPLKQSASTKQDGTAIPVGRVLQPETDGDLGSGVPEEVPTGIGEAKQQMHKLDGYTMEEVRMRQERDQRMQSELARLRSEEEEQSMAEELARRQLEIAKKRAKEAKLLALAAQEEASAAREVATTERSGCLGGEEIV